MNVHWIQFHYRANGRTNGRKYCNEVIVVGAESENAARAFAEANERPLPDHTLIGISTQQRAEGDFVRGHILVVPKPRPE